MNYLTNYYKNLCEQLQEKINILEAEIRSPEQIRTLGKKAFEDAVEKLKAEQGVEFLSNEDLAHIAKTVYSPYVERATKRENLIKRATEQLGDVAMTGDVETAQQYGDVMTDVTRDLYTGKVAGLRNLDPADAARLNDLTSQNYEASKRNRQQGIATSVPADIAAMRKFVEMGRGKYKAPFPQPTEMTPDAFDGSDPDTRGSASEVVSSQRRNQYKGNIKESILPQKPKPIRLPPPPGTFDHPGEILTRTDEWGQKIEVTENDPWIVVEKAKKEHEIKIGRKIGDIEYSVTPSQY